MGKGYKSLSAEQITKLQQQGCICRDWSQVKVSEDFSPERLYRVRFAGEVKLGGFSGKAEIAGCQVDTGIYDAVIMDSEIGDNVYINSVRGHISNYIISDGVVIEGLGVLEVCGETSFGNGIEVSVINENDGRAVPICTRLTAQLAYLTAVYRSREKLVGKLKKMVADFSESMKSDKGHIGENARLVNCGLIRDVRIGEQAVLEGVNKLVNGTVDSCPEDPPFVGSGVEAENFIFGCGCVVSNSVILENCFIGQGSQITNGFSSEDSIFFANCVMSRGESFSIFAGPFTVSHHKATLLIAGVFSFFNAGSGTNQSNHMYKLGPMHQGVMERGSKTGSESHLLWPARMGAFSLVKGRVYSNSDTSELPFSYIFGYETGDILVPGINLISVGTIRDAKKWAKREKRKCSDKLDLVNTDILSPYTMNKAARGLDVLKNLEARVKVELEYVDYRGVKVGLGWLDRGKKVYRMVLDKFIGDCLVDRLKQGDFSNEKELRRLLEPAVEKGAGQWVDIGGMYAPADVLEDIISRLCSDEVDNIDQARGLFREVYAQYKEYRWRWAVDFVAGKSGESIPEMTIDRILDMLKEWKRSTTEWYELVLSDAGKEFSDNAMTGYGVDGDKSVQRADFEAVRGTYNDNKFVKQIRAEIEEVEQIFNELCVKVQKAD